MQDAFARSHSQPLGQARRATVGYIVYNRTGEGSGLKIRDFGGRPRKKKVLGKYLPYERNARKGQLRYLYV